ncbi:hypothetical protein [Actinobaculum massiliense]|uniref:hypothetical protein n=1 Tax=Actinobaculum massiliense TaxID=202789 RepID=UPI000A9C8B60|nr:hypothetical protein [Actinobaculum massiliense]
MNKPKTRLTQQFRTQLQNLPLNHTALARTLHTTPDKLIRILNEQAEPDASFMAEAVNTGLANNFADVAEAIPQPK